nr:hypothetical protein [Tanacetum cinerariifolium]
MADNYFVEYTRIKVKQFRETLLQQMSNVKKSVAERTLDTKSIKIESTVQDKSSRSGNDTDADDANIRPIYNEEPMAEVQLTAECNILAIGHQHTEQPEIIHEVLSPQHIDEFDFNNETSLSEYDEDEQYNLYFNDIFPFNVTHLDDLKAKKDNDDNEIDTIQSSRDMTPLPPRDQRHPWIFYQVEGYIKEIVHDFKQRLETIFDRHVNRVHILYFEGLTLDMRQDLAERMRMVYTEGDWQEVFMSHTWRRLIRIQAPLVQEFIFEFFSICRIENEMGLDVTATLCLQMGVSRRSMTWRQFILALGLHTNEEMVEDKFWHTEGRKSDARLSGCHFIRRLAHHFGLVSDDGLRGLSIVARELPLIDTCELVELNICMDLGDDWAWAAPRPEMQQVTAAGALEAAEDGPTVDEGDQAISAPVQAPQQPPRPSTATKTTP